MQRIRARVKEWRKAYPKGEITKEKIIERFTAWDAWAAHGDTYSLRLKYAKQVSEIVGEEIKPRRKITANRTVSAKRKLKQLKQSAKAVKGAEVNGGKRETFHKGRWQHHQAESER